MINIGNNSIENILVGNTLVDRVYLGTDIVWEHQQPSVKDYLKFTALESGTFTLTIPANVTTSYITSISYSLDNGATWVTTLNSSSAITITTPTIDQGDSILWKGTGKRMAYNNTTVSNFSSTCNFKASGNIMSLVYGDDFEDKLVLPGVNCFMGLFKHCSTMTTAPKLPATTLTSGCYREMFHSTSITDAPELPATTIAGACYRAMFYNCANLTDAPELPATTMYSECYYSMFGECTSLVNASELPATTLTIACYFNMFYNCKSLQESPIILADNILYNLCMAKMFLGCSSLRTITCLATLYDSTKNSLSDWVNQVPSNGTFIKNPNATFWPSGRNGIPSTWTVVDYNS